MPDPARPPRYLEVERAGSEPVRLREPDDLAFEIDRLDSATELEPGMRLDVPAAVVVRPPLAIPVGTRGQAADEPTDLGKRHRDGPGRGAEVTAEGLVFRLVFAPTSG